MTLAEEARDAFADFFERVRAGTLQAQIAEGGAAGEARHGASPGNHHDVVLILTAEAAACGIEQADDGEGGVANADRLAYGIAFAEEGGGSGFADERDFGLRTHVLFGERAAAGESPIAKFGIAGGDADDGGADPSYRRV